MSDKNAQLSILRSFTPIALLINMLYSKTNKMHLFICVYSKIVLYMFQMDIPFIIRSYLLLYMQLFVHIMLMVTSHDARSVHVKLINMYFMKVQSHTSLQYNQSGNKFQLDQSNNHGLSPQELSIKTLAATRYEIPSFYSS